MHDDDFKQTLAKLRPVIGDMADAFWLSSILDPTQKHDVQAVSQALAAELLGESYVGEHILLEPPPSNDAAGEYPLGTVTYAGKRFCPFGLRESELPQHVAVLGRSGAGKTNVGYLLAWNLLKSGRPFLVLDWRGNYRHLANRPEGKDLRVFGLGEPESLSFNPLDPPPNLTDSQRQAYLREIVSVVCNTYTPGSHLLSTRGAEYLLLLSAEELAGSKPLTFNAVRSHLARRKTRSRQTEWKVAADSVLYRLTTGPLGRLVNSLSSITLAGVLDSPVVLELSGLGSESDRSFFSQALLVWLYYCRLADSRTRGFKHAVIAEEAHHLFLRRGHGQSVHDAMLRQFRDLGEALILLDQNPSLLSVPALGNTGTTICMNLKHGDDVQAAGKALALRWKDYESVGKLPVGQAVVRVQGRRCGPFLVSFPEFRVSRDERPAARQRRIPGGDSPEERPRETGSAGNEAIRPLRRTDWRNESEPRITGKGSELLIDVAKHPLSTVTERYARLGWTPHTGTKVKGKLLRAGLLAQEKVRVPNGSVTLLKATDAGQAALESIGVPVKALPRNASLEHEYWKELTATQYEARGYRVEREVPLGDGRAVDLVATKDDERVAIEVETGKSDAAGNVRKCREAGFDRVVVVGHQPRSKAIKILPGCSALFE